MYKQLNYTKEYKIFSRQKEKYTRHIYNGTNMNEKNGFM